MSCPCPLVVPVADFRSLICSSSCSLKVFFFFKLSVRVEDLILRFLQEFDSNLYVANGFVLLIVLLSQIVSIGQTPIVESTGVTRITRRKNRRISMSSQPIPLGQEQFFYPVMQKKLRDPSCDRSCSSRSSLSLHMKFTSR